MNGWCLDVNNDKYIIQSESLLRCGLDVICIAETHIRGNAIPTLNGYSVFSTQS